MALAMLLIAPQARAADIEATARSPLPSETGDFALRLEPGFAVPLTDPQSQRFSLGGAQTIKALWSIGPYVDIGPSVTFMILPSDTPAGDSGIGWTFGAGARFKRPHHAPDDDMFYAVSPWVDADALYVRTGDLNRGGFSAAVGLAVPITDARIFWIGPFVRYNHIFSPTREGFDTNDAKIISVGISLEVGGGIEREPEPVVAAAVRTVNTNTEVFVCADRDKDEVPDTVDQCPDAKGPKEHWGCPQYANVVVKQDKLELKERLYFAWNKAILQPASYPALDDVVQALKDNASFRVQVEGHTSSEGVNDHNQTLSEERAAAVLDYLVEHGIDRARLVSKGFASSVPADTNATSLGRENNRRVEFVVNFNILDGGSN